MTAYDAIPLEDIQQLEHRLGEWADHPEACSYTMKATALEVIEHLATGKPADCGGFRGDQVSAADEAELELFRRMDSDSFSWKIERAVIQPGRTFSAEAMDALSVSVVRFIGARIMARWDGTGEPPSVVAVSVEVR